jgi:hypothetical protein
VKSRIACRRRTVPFSAPRKRDPWADFIERYFVELKPKGILEEQLVERLAHTAWRMEQFATREEVRILDVSGRHQQHLKRMYQQMLKSLKRLQSLRTP